MVGPLTLMPRLPWHRLAAQRRLLLAVATLLLAMTGALALMALAPGFAAAPLRGLAAVAAGVCGLVGVGLLAAAFTGKLAARERLWQQVLDSSGIGVGVGDWNLRANRIVFSPRWLALLGYATQEFGRDMQAFWSRVHAEDAVALQLALERLRSAAAAEVSAACRMRCRDGQWRWLELHAFAAERDAAGAPLRVVHAAFDLTERDKARAREQLTQSLFQHLQEGLLITDAEHRVLEANPSFSEITGYSREQLQGSIPALLLERGGAWRGEIEARRHSGDACTLAVSVSAVKDAGGTVHMHVLGISDITRARRQLEQLRRQAHFDELTRLPNRARLAQMLHAGLSASRREGRCCATASSNSPSGCASGSI